MTWNGWFISSLLALFPVSLLHLTFMSCFTLDLLIPWNRTCFLCHLTTWHLLQGANRWQSFPGAMAVYWRMLKELLAGNTVIFCEASVKCWRQKQDVLGLLSGYTAYCISIYSCVNSWVQSWHCVCWFSYSLQDDKWGNWAQQVADLSCSERIRMREMK